MVFSYVNSKGAGERAPRLHTALPRRSRAACHSAPSPRGSIRRRLAAAAARLSLDGAGRYRVNSKIAGQPVHRLISTIAILYLIFKKRYSIATIDGSKF